MMAGRSEVTAAIDEALAVAVEDARTPRPIVLTGSRGVGKSVLLALARRVAGERHSWISVDVEAHATRSLLPDLSRLMLEADRLYTHAPAKNSGWQLTRTTVKAAVAGLGGEAQFTRSPMPHPAPQSADPAVTRADLQVELSRAMLKAMTAAVERGAGLVLTIDEAHAASRDDLATVAALLQDAAGRSWPLVALMAGLTGLQERGRVVTYLERAEWHHLGLLGHDDALSALTIPAAEAGRPFTDEAAQRVADASGGYPYALQLLGYHSWRASEGADRIEVTHADTGVAWGHRDMAAGLYTSRWNAASPREREYLAALALVTQSGDPATGAAVAELLGGSTSAAGGVRRRLLRKGTLYPDGGALRFAVPGMVDWVARRGQEQEADDDRSSHPPAGSHP